MEIKNPHSKLCLLCQLCSVSIVGLTVKIIYLLTMQIARIVSVSWVIAGGVGFFDMCLLISMLRPHTHTTTPPTLPTLLWKTA